MSAFKNVMAAGTTVAVLGAGLYAYDHLPDCLKQSDVKECLLHLGEPPSSHASIGGLAIDHTAITSNVSYHTEGEAAVSLKGTATVDYDSGHGFNYTPGIDSTWFYNEDNKRTSLVTISPCIKAKDDYTNASEAAFGYKVLDDAAGNPVKVETNPLKVIACSPHYDAGNQYLWKENSQGVLTGIDAKTPDTGIDTMRADMQRIFEQFTVANACPQALVDIGVVQEDVAETIMGNVDATHPEISDKVRALFAAAKPLGFTVDSPFSIAVAPMSQDPAAGQELTKLVQDITSRDRSVPVAGGKKTIKMKYNIDASTLNVESCKTVTPLKIVPNS